MHITINNIIGKKRIDLSYPIQNFNLSKEVTAVGLLSDSIQYKGAVINYGREGLEGN